MKAPADRQSKLVSYLPDEERTALESIVSKEINVKEFDSGHLLDKVHWSWFLPTLKMYPDAEQQNFLAVLPHFASKNLATMCRITLEPQSITHIGKKYLRQVLLDSLLGEKDRLLPIDFLPENRLLKYSKKELIRLIDLLGIHDLAQDLRQIVETKILKKIYSFLTMEEKKLLKDVTGRQEYHIAPFGLDKWDGTEEPFRHMLHKRGLARFAIALSGENPDFLWYLCHRLDIGRGTALYKLISPIATPITPSVAEQINSLVEAK